MTAAALNPALTSSQKPFDHVSKREGWNNFSFGKYREIIIAVGFFLLFDLGVLVLNFYTSFQIAEDAVGINLAGRQRMLSQRTAKAMLLVDTAQSNGTDTSSAIAELRKSTELFDVTLQSFQRGGVVPGGDGKPVHLPAVSSEQAQITLGRAQAVWNTYQTLLKPVIYGNPTPSDISIAAEYARLHNVELLGLMNDLTTSLEAVASNRANTLRLVQTGGIALALLNFVFILFKFLRRLRNSDAAIEAATEENREILSSVREGLFLLTPHFTLGSQISKSAHTLFGQTMAAGDKFLTLLAPLVSQKVLTDAKGYVELLFSPHIKESLVQNINPLQSVQVNTLNHTGQNETRHLCFYFNRVMDGTSVRHLLVTVQDISARMALESQIHAERQRSQREFNMLLKAFETDPAMLRQFVARSESGLLEINEHLRATSHTHGDGAIRKALDIAARRIHALKGDASTLGLQSLAEQAHSFENDLARMRESDGALLGDALLALPMHLENLLSTIHTLKGLTQNYRSNATGFSAHSINTTLSELATQVAQEAGKRVATNINVQAHAELEDKAQDLVREIMVQLIRNAVVHGIESPTERAALRKPEAGKLDVSLQQDGEEWCLRVRDDGAGLNAPQIANKLVQKGWYTPLQLENFSEQQIVAHIFKTGFSTAAAADIHAGRGVGLDVVQHNVQQLGARLLLSSTLGRYTEFEVRFQT